MSATAMRPGQHLHDGPGTDTIAIGNDGAFVILTFQAPVKWVQLDPKTSYQVAEMMCRHAFATEIKDKVEGEWSSLIQKKRGNLLAKFEHALTAAYQNGDITGCTELWLKKMAAQLVEHADDEYLGPRFTPTTSGKALIVSDK